MAHRWIAPSKSGDKFYRGPKAAGPWVNDLCWQKHSIMEKEVYGVQAEEDVPLHAQSLNKALTTWHDFRRLKRLADSPAPDGKAHGTLTDNAPHAGDLPNVHADAEGKVAADVTSVALPVDGDAAPMMDDPRFAADIAELEMDLMTLECTEQRFLFNEGGPDAMGAEASMLKVRGTELQQYITELLVEVLGYYALAHVPEQLEEGFNGKPVGPLESGYAALNYFNMRKTAIYSGSNEIQKNIISKLVLGL